MPSFLLKSLLLSNKEATKHRAVSSQSSGVRQTRHMSHKAMQPQKVSFSGFLFSSPSPGNNISQSDYMKEMRLSV